MPEEQSFHRQIPSERAFGTIATFRGRCEMIVAAGEAYAYLWQDDIAAANLPALLNRYRGLGARRNEIAHGQVGSYKPYMNVRHPSDPSRRAGYCLLPPWYNTNKTPLLGPPKFVYSGASIDALRNEIPWLIDDAECYSKQIIRYVRQCSEGSARGRA